MYNSTVVTTTYGPVRGRIDHAGVASFKGIRYGSDTASYRFQPPRPPAAWTDVVNAFEFGPTSPQDHPDQSVDRAENPWLQMMGLTDNLPESEDCLVVNVWTPGTAAQAAESGEPAPARPVLVWVHSGGYSDNSGSSPSVDGARLATEHDLVVVSFNHRLGVLGYTQVVDPVAHPDSPYAASGNVGQLDIVAVLEWVRDNIAAFGGDPGSVTLAGQSGGAMKISVLLAMPQAQPLFHRAILQSGTTVRVLEPEEAQRPRDGLLDHLGLDTSHPEALAEVPLPELMRAYKETAEGLTTFGPVLDGTIVPHHPFSAESVALSGDKPLIIGDMDTEAALFLLFQRDQLLAAGPEEVTERLATATSPQYAEDLVAAIRARSGELNGHELAVQIVSDGLFTGPAHAACLRRAAGAPAPTWRYRDVLTTPAHDGALMSPHELDVALTFGNIEAAEGLNGGTEDAREVSRIIGATWAAFVRGADPANEAIPAWPAYTAEEREVLVISPEPAVEKDVDGAALDVAAGVSDRLINWFAVLSA